jgi:two-component system, LuxR family, response regulator FixJ
MNNMQLSNDLLLLNPKEISVAKLIAEGKNNKEIGEQVGLSPRTIERYKEAIMKKMKCRTIAAAMVKCVGVGIIAYNPEVSRETSS